MEIHSLSRVKDETTVIVGIDNFMSIKETFVRTEFRVPFDHENQLKWGLHFLRPRDDREMKEELKQVFLTLTNPKDKSNNVLARLRSVIVDHQGNDASEEKCTVITDYSNFIPGGGEGVHLIKRDKVEQLLVKGSLMIKCVVCVAEEIKCDVIENLIPIGTGIQVDFKIANFMNCAKELVSETIVTPFDAQVRWRVHVYPYGYDKQDKGHVLMGVCKANKENKEKIKSCFSVLDSKREVAFSRQFEKWDDQGNGWPKFISREEIQNRLVKGTDLHLRINIEYKE